MNETLSDEVRLIYATAPDMGVAEDIAARLLEARLAACVNLFPGVRAVFNWEGEVHKEEEVAMIVKTTAAEAGKVRAAILEAHPYDLPAIVALPVDAAASHAPFLQWIAEETADTGP